MTSWHPSRSIPTRCRSVLVAATYPLDVVKAGRFVSESADLDDKARATAAEAEPWDPSVQVLAGGFPSVVVMMADDLDWTEALGDVVIVQTDDVLDAVQRMRARAAAVGNLESNEAQVVEIDKGAVSIAPADPEIVYVPTYDPATAYFATTTAAPIVVDGRQLRRRSHHGGRDRLRGGADHRRNLRRR